MKSLTTDHRKNNFDLLRLLAAFLVLFSHSYGLMGKGPVQPTIWYGSNKLIASDLGLYIFFTISGYLVSKSLFTSSSVKQYLWKRFLRIWPGLVIVNLACIIIGSLITHLSLKDYWLNSSPWLFFLCNISLVTLRYEINGVFTNLQSDKVNSSLWTILLEVKFYLLLILLKVFPFLKNKWLLLAGYIPVILLHSFRKSLELNHDLQVYLEFGSFFYSGVLLNIFRSYIPQKWFYPVMGAAIWFLIPVQPLKETLLVIFLSYTILLIGNAKQVVDLRGNDISYGFYLYAFPVQQLVFVWLGYDMAVWQHILYSVAITVPLALASWYFIEKPFLEKKSVVW